MTKREKDLIRGAWIAWGVSLALIIAALLLVHGCAHAHDHNRPDLTPWFEKLQSKSGTPCCDGKDGQSLDDPDWAMSDDQKHFRVRLDGKWYDVPDNAIVMIKTAPVTPSYGLTQ